MSSEPFNFTSTSGYSLSGRLERPVGEPMAWALFAHCFTCGKDNRTTVRIARALADNGVGVLRFDFAGLGQSGGQFADSGFLGDVADLKAASETMASRGIEPSLLVGHSLGGAAALAAAGDMPSIRAVATIGAPFEISHVLHQFAPEALDQIKVKGQADVVLGKRHFIVKQSFVDDIRRGNLSQRIATLHRPLLVMHAPTDTTVGIENAAQIFEAAKHPKSFVSLDDGDHFVSRNADSDFIAAVITAWAKRYLKIGNVDAAA